MYKACLAVTGLVAYVCVAAVTQRRLEHPLGCKSRVIKTAELSLLLCKSSDFISNNTEQNYHRLDATGSYNIHKIMKFTNKKPEL